MMMTNMEGITSVKELESLSNPHRSDGATEIEGKDARIASLMMYVEELTEITKRQVKIIEKQQERNTSKKVDAFEEYHDMFERSTVRLDGLEVYAVVSALTVASSIACMDAYGDIFYRMQVENSATGLATVMHIFFVLTNTVGILAGLHSTLIFSLATMYGRTAVGLGRDEAFHKFFECTGLQRYRGFKTFLLSLYSFTMQIVMTIILKFLPKTNIYLKCTTFIAFFAIASPVYRDTNHVVRKAEVIFDPAYQRRRSMHSATSLMAPQAVSLTHNSSSVETETSYELHDV